MNKITEYHINKKCVLVEIIELQKKSHYKFYDIDPNEDNVKYL